MQGKLDRFMRERDVLEVTSLSRTTLWRVIKLGKFPRAVAISPGRVGWRESSIASWQQDPQKWTSSDPIEAA